MYWNIRFFQFYIDFTFISIFFMVVNHHVSMIRDGECAKTIIVMQTKQKQKTDYCIAGVIFKSTLIGIINYHRDTSLLTSLGLPFNYSFDISQ